MKILLIGASGTVGQAVYQELAHDHEIITAGPNQADLKVDISDPASIKQLFENAGKIDAVISTTGQVHFAPLSDMNHENYQIGLDSKLMGQINLVLIGQHYLNDGGSFTLISGIINHDPIPAGSAAATVNGALDSFVLAASTELPRGLRVNIVSPTMLEEAVEKYGPAFKGYKPVPGKDVALAFRKSVDGLQTGRVFKVGY